MVEDKDVKIVFRNILLDDGKLLIDVNVDYSKFNLFKGFTKKQQEDWEVNFDIKGSELVDMSKSYKFNKSIDLNINDKNSKIEIEELKVSPIYMTINCKYYGIDNGNIYNLELKILDQ